MPKPKKKKEPEFLSGVYDDESDEQKLKRFQLSEVVTAPVFDWKEKPQSEWRKFSIRSQNGSGMCAYQTLAKLLGINNFVEEGLYVELSSYDGYQQRAKPSVPGANVNDIIKSATVTGLTLQEFAPDQDLTEAQANALLKRTVAMKRIAEIFKGKNVVFLNNIEEIAFAIQSGKGVMMWFRWDYDEWDKPVPTINPNSLKKYHHSITGVDPILYQGKKAVVIEDSWGKGYGLNGQRVLTEEWFTSGRMTLALYVEDLNNLAVQNETQAKPIYNFTRVLMLGMKGYDVAMLQRCLGYLKDENGYLFPLSQEPTGNYLGVTRSAVKRFQKAYNIPQDGIVSGETMAFLNQLFK